MSKFIQIENVVFNIEEIQKIYSGYFQNMIEQYWFVKVLPKGSGYTAYKFDTQKQAEDFIDLISEKLEAVKV